MNQSQVRSRRKSQAQSIGVAKVFATRRTKCTLTCWNPSTCCCRKLGRFCETTSQVLDVHELSDFRRVESNSPLDPSLWIGSVMMNTKLTGMPECKFGLNDKLVIDKDKEDRKPSVEIDDCTFHRCVRLGKFDADRTITFIPPDGEFELMKYRVGENINLPFRLIPAVQEEHNLTKVSINLKIIANFSDQLFATHVVIKIPVPKNTAKTKIKHSFGRAKYEPEQQAIVWRVKRFAGKAECIITAEVDLMPTVRPKPWSRPPIQCEFQVPMFTASGVHVRFLRVFDKSGYHTNRWVRYITKAGSYQIRI
jgi:AP-2 complex subunit mu-1